MKNTLVILLLSFVLFSCKKQPTETIDAIIASNKLSKIKEKKQQVIAQLQKLDAAIKALDTAKNNLLVNTLIVKDSIFKHYLQLQGVVQTKQNVIIYPEIAGILKRVYINEGQNIAKGQLIATIDDGGLSQQLEQLHIEVELSKTTFERQERLWNQKIGSEIQYLQAKSSYQAQQKAIEQLKAQLQKTNIRAPFSGIIDKVITQQGEVVLPGQSQLVRLISLNNMYIEADVPETYIANITKHKTVQVEFPVLGTMVATKIRQVSHFINPDNRTFKIEVAVPNNDKSVKPNLSAKLNINDYTNPKAILIPQSIISEDADGKQYVYSITNKTLKSATAQKQYITTGKTQGDYVEVFGIANKTELINEGARNVRDGQSVEIKNN